MSLVLLPLFYALALASGAAVAAGGVGRSWLARVLIMLAYAAAQILVSVQALSLVHQLGPTTLFLANAGLTALTFFARQRMLPRRIAGAGEPLFPAMDAASDRREAWRAVLAFPRENPVPALMLVLAVLFAVGLEILRSGVAPYGDTYHWTMPLFWREYASALPFPSTNPRVNGFVFGSEGLCSPGVWYAQSFVMYSVFTVFTKMIIVWIVAAIAWRLGVSAGSAVAAGAIFLANSALLDVAVEALFATMWAGAAIYLAVEASPGRGQESRADRAIFGWAVFCIVLACGAKNVMALPAPLLLLFVLWAGGRRAFAWRSLGAMALGGVLGLLCSTVAWNYASNYYWYRDLRGPSDLKATLSHDFRPVAVWTRVLRSSSGTLLDPLWLPGGMLDAYAHLLQKTVWTLGGAETLPEDDEYYSFTRGALRPNTGLNPVGLLLYVPGLCAAWVASRRRELEASTRPGVRPRLAPALSLLSVSAVLLGFAVLRTQQGGVVRLLCGTLLAGAPLSALLLEWRWVRGLALVLQIGTGLAYTVLFSGNLVRRTPENERSWLGTQIAKLQRPHTLVADCRWSDRPAEKLVLREDYSTRELCQLAVARAASPTTFGSMSSFNSEDIYFFGPRYATNRVLCLRDMRAPDHALPVPSEVQYIVSDYDNFADLDYAAQGFTEWLRVTREGWAPFVVLRRK